MDKQHAHQLLDQLAPGQLEAVVHLLEVMIDPDIVSPQGAYDDEPVTEEEERAVAESKEWFKHNQGIPMEEVVAELGLTMEQIRGHQGPVSDRMESSPRKPKATFVLSTTRPPCRSSPPYTGWPKAARAGSKRPAASGKSSARRRFPRALHEEGRQ